MLHRDRARGGRRRDLRAAALAALLCVLPYLPALARPSGVLSSSHSDILSQDLPWRVFLSETLARDGAVPAWNPLQLGGLPVRENLSIPLFYPPFLPYLAGGIPWLYALEMALHSALMGLGAFFLARRLGASRAAAVLTACAFALGARSLAHAYAGHMVLLAEMAWSPWVLLLADQLRASPRRAIPLALCLGAILLCGHPQVFLYTVLLAGTWCLVRAWPGRRGRARRIAATAVAYGGAVLGGFLVGAAQILPSLLYARETGRAGGLDIGFAGAYSLDPLSMLQLLLPLPLGHPATHDYWGPPNYWERCAYLGLPALLLAAAAIGKGRPLRNRGLLFALFAATLLFALGPRTPLYPLLFHVVPGLDQLRVPARALWFTSLFVSLLAGAGLDHLLAHRTRPGRVVRLVPILSAVAAAGAIGAVAGAPWIRKLGRSAVRRLYESDPGSAGHTHPLGYWLRRLDLAQGTITSAVLALAVLAGALALVLLAFRQRRLSRRACGALVVGLVLLESAYVGGRHLSWRSLTGYPWTPPVVGEIGPTRGRFRVLDQAGTISLSVAFREGIELVGGYDASVPGRYLAYVNAMAGREGQPPATRIAAQRVPIDGRWRRWWLDGVGARYVITRTDLRGLGFARRRSWRDSSGRVVHLFENPTCVPRATLHATWRTARGAGEAEAMMRASGDAPVLVVEGAGPPPPGATTGEVTRLAYGNDHVLLSTRSAGPSMLLFADTWSRGWSARLDGEPVPLLPANLAFRAIRLPAGAHDVEMSYTPRARAASLVLSGLAAAFLGLLGLLLRRRADRASRARELRSPSRAPPP